MNTMEGTPARAACARPSCQVSGGGAGDRVKPKPRAGGERHRDDESLKEWVGLAESSFTHSGACTPDAVSEWRPPAPTGQPGLS